MNDSTQHQPWLNELSEAYLTAISCYDYALKPEISKLHKYAMSLPAEILESLNEADYDLEDTDLLLELKLSNPIGNANLILWVNKDSNIEWKVAATENSEAMDKIINLLCWK